MLEARPLFKRDYDEIFKLAKKIALQNSSEWQTESEADPGITFLEVFSVLKDFQQVYMEQISYKSLERILKFIGQECQHGEPAQYVSKEVYGQHQTLQEGFKRQYNGVTIEVADGGVVADSEVANIVTLASGEIHTVCDFPLREDRNMLPFGSVVSHQGAFYVGLTSRPTTGRLKLFFEMDMTGRNPLNTYIQKLSYPVATLTWFAVQKEASSGHVARVPLTVISDETQGLLFSGIVELDGLEHLQQGGPLEDENYYIYCEGSSCRYEEAPRIKRLYTNPVRWVQRDTLAKSWHFVLGGDEKAVTIHHGRVEDSFFRVMIKSSEGYVFVPDDQVVTVLTHEALRLQLNEALIKTYRDQQGEKPIELLICAYDKRLQNYHIIGSGTGASEQKITLEYKDLLYEAFELMIEEKGQWQRWSKSKDLSQCSKYDRCYTLNPTTGAIEFGDGYHGRVPAIGKDNILLTDLALSSFDQGSFYGGDSDLYLAKAGKRAIDLETLKGQSMNRSVFGESLVTLEDYEKLVRQFPGLKIGDVKVTSPEENHIQVEISVDAGKYQKFWFKFYEENLLDYMASYKVITTAVTIKKW
ncbi:MAG: hypothetical protein JXO44_05940 [Clostridia bacterium]|nr:hypothetical protein [Clostridia bacterium]